MKAFDRYASFTDLAALKEVSSRPLRKSLRVNTLRISLASFKKYAASRGWELSPVPWCPEGFFIEREDRSQPLGKDLLHLLGCFYIQEAASMLPPVLLDPQPGETILDMSSAPGSKTTQMAAMLQGRGSIVANDVQEKRLWALKTNLHRQCVSNVIVTRKVGQWFARHMTERFDRVLCDAPCTAQGTVRKDSDALRYCGPENIAKMARLQTELLASAIDAAKVGGRIVYSTCTLTQEENEMVVHTILNTFPEQVRVVDPQEIPLLRASLDIQNCIKDSLTIQQELGMTPEQPCIRLWPQTADTEGFFCAVFQKTSSTRVPERMEWVHFQEREVLRKERAQMVADLEERFGIPFVREDERLFARGAEVLLANDAVAEMRLPVQDYALGLPFAKLLDGQRFRLHSEAAIARGSAASRNVVDLSPADVEPYLAGKDGSCDPALHGDVIVRIDGRAVGLGLAKDGILLNRLPRWMVGMFA